VTFDLRWKAACGLAVTDTSFHATTLTYWRRRLAASTSPDRIFDAVRTMIKQTGVIKGKTRRVLDSTVLDDAVATQDTVTQLVAAIRRVLRVVPGSEAVLVGRETACDYTRPGKPDIAWDDKPAKAALINALVLDALTLLNALSSNDTDTDTDTDADAGTDDSDEGTGDGTDEAGQALALLALLAGQDVEWIDDGAGGGVWRI